MTFNMTNFFNEAKKKKPVKVCSHSLICNKSMQIFFQFDDFFTMTFKILIFTITWKIRLSLYDSSNTMPLKFDGIFFGKKLFFSQFVNVNKLKLAYRKYTMLGSVSLHSLFRSESGSWTSYYYTIIRSCRHCRAETWVDFASIFRLSHRNGKSKRCPSALDSSRRILLNFETMNKISVFSACWFLTNWF